MKATVSDFVGIYEECCPVEWCNDVIKGYELAKKQGFFLDRQQYDNFGRDGKDDECFWSGMSYGAQLNSPSKPRTGETEMGFMALESSVGEEFNRMLWQECYPHYSDTYSALKNAEHHTNWKNKIQKTDVGQGYHIWHFEQSSKDSSQRMMAYIFYLNDVEEGGETEFLYLHKRIKPKAGTMILFPASYTHTHRGNPPLSSEKYIITGWIEL
jgi:hypothetical protein